MRQMYDKTSGQMIHWKWDNPHPIREQVDRSKPQTRSSRKFQRTSEGFSGYGSHDLRVKIEQPCWRQYKPRNFIAVILRYWGEMMDEDDDDMNWTDAGAPSGGNNIDDSHSEKQTQGSGKGTGKGKGTKDGKGQGKEKAMKEGKGKGMGNCTGKGIVGKTPGRDDISRAFALQLQKRMYDAHWDMEGYLERVYLELGILPAVWIFWDNGSDSTKKSDSEYYSEHDSDLNMPMEDVVDTQDGFELDGDVDMERDGDKKEEEDEEQEEEEDKEDEDEDDGKEPGTIGQGEIVNWFAEGIDPMVDDPQIMLPE